MGRNRLQSMSYSEDMRPPNHPGKHPGPPCLIIAAQSACICISFHLTLISFFYHAHCTCQIRNRNITEANVESTLDQLASVISLYGLYDQNRFVVNAVAEILGEVNNLPMSTQV